VSFVHFAVAARTLREGGIVAYPTEAVYGLGCDPWNDGALRRLLAIKRRSPRRGLIVVGADFAQLESLIERPPMLVQDKLMRTWPGHVTWLLSARPHIPKLLRGGHDSLAVRVSAHPVVVGLCRRFGGPIVSTSANRAGAPPARTALAVRTRFSPREVDLVLTGDVGGFASPSEIRDARTDRVIRTGG
jgi:L-threonylcarbamoyladenylate synthase